MGQFSKAYKDLCFSDNYIFCKVMRNERLCKQMLEILLGIKVEKIVYLQTEHSIENFYDSRGIRMDVYIQDYDRVFDMEMQTGDYEDIILRSRYYQSSVDVSTTKRRTKYKDLKESFVIFICKDDPFGSGLPVYTKKTTFLETDIPYNDKTHNVFYNASAWKKAEDEKVRDVLEFIYLLKANSPFTKELESSVEDAKIKSEWEDEYMYFQDILEDEKEEAREKGHAEGLAAGLSEGREKGLAEGLAEGLVEGRAEGREEGLVEGRAEGLAEGLEKEKIEITKKMISDNIPYETIAKYTSCTVHEIQKIAETVNK